MKNSLFHIIIFVGALSNAVLMTMMGVSTIILITTTVGYVVLFELLLLVLEPRLAIAERKRNLKKYPFLKDLIDAKKATVTLINGEIIYNAAFAGYLNSKDAKTIKLAVTTPKTKKTEAKVETRDILLVQIKDVKKLA